MGFGTLFIGYFLIFNITHYGLTDIISALVMLMALNKLVWVNKDFKNALFVNFSFVFVSFLSLIVEIVGFFEINFDILIAIISPMRAAILFSLSLFILRGILSLSKEVGTKDISVRAKRNIILAPIVYIPFFVLELPLNLLLPTEAVPIISVIGIIITLLHVILIALNAILIYSCYMRICMPDEEKAEKETKGIGGFFEKSRKEHKDALLESKSKDKNNV